MNADIHPRPDTDFMRIVVIGLFVVWFAFSLQMAWQGRYAGSPGTPPIALGLSVVLPNIIVGAGLSGHSARPSTCASWSRSMPRA